MRFPLFSTLFLLFTLSASAKDTVILGVNEGGTANQMEREMAGIVAHVNTSPDIAKVLDLGVDGIISDRPDRVREEMKRRGMELPAS